jgi:hypothetical protein
MLVLSRRAGRSRSAARLVGVGHAFLHEGAPRLALEVLVMAPNLQVAILFFAVAAQVGVQDDKAANMAAARA